MTDLLAHRPGDAVAAKVLEVQSTYDDRRLLARLCGVSPLAPEARSWYKGTLGEHAVGRELDGLGAGWTVLHSVPVGSKGSDVDHVVIGPGGIFTVNTKNHAGQTVWVAGGSFLVAGRRTNHVRNAVHEADRAAQLLGAASAVSLPVRAVIVVVDPERLTVKEQPERVAVLTSRQLVRWLRRRPTVLSPEEVVQAVHAARRPGTWTTRAPHLGDLDTVRAGFTALQAEVASARRVRAGWMLGLMAACATFLLTGGPEAVSPSLTALLGHVVPQP